MADYSQEASVLIFVYKVKFYWTAINFKNIFSFTLSYHNF